jgi:hypothetical protein
MNEPTRYDDGNIVCDDTSLLIRRYYPWGEKRVPYASIKSVKRLPIRVRRWRLYASGDFVHWWNLDLKRPKKRLALDIDVGRRIHPTITPDEPDTVERILNLHATKTAASGPDAEPHTGRP